MSWNVRGLNDWGKHLILRGCFARWKLEIVCFQETKLDEYSDEIIKSLWKEADVGWHAILVRGSVGGIIIMWREERVKCVGVVKGGDYYILLVSQL